MPIFIYIWNMIIQNIYVWIPAISTTQNFRCLIPCSVNVCIQFIFKVIIINMVNATKQIKKVQYFDQIIELF